MAYYDILGLDSQCTTEEIKKSYRRLAIKVRMLHLLYNAHLTRSSIQTRIGKIQMPRKRWAGKTAQI